VSWQRSVALVSDDVGHLGRSHFARARALSLSIYIYTYIHTYIQSFLPVSVSVSCLSLPLHTQACLHVCVRMRIYTVSSTHSSGLVVECLLYTCIHIHTCTHAYCMHMCAHTHTHCRLGSLPRFSVTTSADGEEEDSYSRGRDGDTGMCVCVCVWCSTSISCASICAHF
jgi:hypothetical protein